MNIWQQFHGPNAGYILELYERYQQDPHSVDEATRAQFAHWTPPTDTPPTTSKSAQPSNRIIATAVAAPPPTTNIDKVVQTVRLAYNIREYGHQAAQLDPLGTPPPDDQSLHLSYHGLSEADLQQLPANLIDGPIAAQSTTALQVINGLRQTYSSHIGYDYDHIRLLEERQWLRTAAESGRFRPTLEECANQLLNRLTEVETFELFLHRIFPGKTRFSIEGLDMMVPMLDEIIASAAESGIYNILIGMAHRGRLNVLAHVLDKPYAAILAEFKDFAKGSYATREYLGWTGDVKYHAGARRTLKEGELISLAIKMAPNPSHLEHVNPVLMGMARAAGASANQPGAPTVNHYANVPILIHGDAAFPGQGIVAETLNMHRLPGYTVGGTIHIIANNQVGFTADDWASRSTLYASDLAKGFKIPIVHVNADDPIACMEVARLAFAYRQTFQKDFLIDLIGYRRYGHNEGDEPRFTQPLMYQRVDAHPTVRQLWAQTLDANRIVPASESEALFQQKMNRLETIYQSLPHDAAPEPQLTPPPPGAARNVDTAVSADTLRTLNTALLTLPPGFQMHSKLERAMKRRLTALDEETAAIDWGTAELLALASILADGTPIRLTGEDVERGTFSQRHALFRDAHTNAPFVPLQTMPQARAAFEIWNSPLSENAAVGFEYGYNLEAPERLVLWEAQYGDFINTAQAIIDEFVVSGRAKWEQTPSLVLLLPHGYEGQGPDHSTGRLERFLQLAAEINMRVVNPTTAAQYFHLLRRQAALLQTDPLPLIVMTPKSLLRHPLAATTLHELSNGRWQPIIDDDQANPEQVRRLIFCSGKVYVDLMSSNYRANHPEVAIVRLEQIYPFPVEEIAPLLAHYAQAEEVVWLQEEPVNMGAWEFVRPLFEELLNGRLPLRYVGRPRRASPAEGSTTWHKINQEAIIEQAFQ
jgi:2-oxoglutarate dehydrogenase E1 component